MFFPPGSLKESIYATLAFFDLFDHPLTLVELHAFLLGNTVTVAYSLEDIGNFLQTDKQIAMHNGYYYFLGRENILSLRFERQNIADQYWKKVHTFLPWLQMIPYVRMVAVCNTLALNVATSESDIDLFIITKKKRIFLARTFCTLFFLFFGVLRHHNKIAGRFCLSFYVSEESLNLEHIQIRPYDIYLFFWFVTLKPFFGEYMYSRFLEANRWSGEYFSVSGFQQQKWKKYGILKRIALFQEFFLNLGFGFLFEKILTYIHLWRYEKRRACLGAESSVIVNKTMLKFHNVDRRKEFANQWEKRYKKFLGLASS